jgi:hypothetical protein
MNETIAGPCAEDVERAGNLARIIRVYAGQLGLTGDLPNWAESGDSARVLADIETLTGTLDTLRRVVTGGAA